MMMTNGESDYLYFKRLLPTYDVFYEKRYYKPWEEVQVVDTWDAKVWITICEDMRDEWYDNKPVAESIAAWADMIINLSSSPFAINKTWVRQDIIKNHVISWNVPFVYVNQVWGQDGNVTDGWSMIYNAAWERIWQWPRFTEHLEVVDMDKQYDIEPELEKYAEVHETIITWLRDFLTKSGIKNVVIWVSGGIDSAVNLYFLSKVLEKENIFAYYLPSQYSQSQKYIDDIVRLSGIDIKTLSLQNVFDQAKTDFKDQASVEFKWLVSENFQAQYRWVMLMTLAREHNAVVINNSNRTEITLWYATIYWDTIGFLSTIWDLKKTEVYDLARWVNKNNGSEIIAESVINRAASAELSEWQVDPFDYTKECDWIDAIMDNKWTLEAIKLWLTPEKAQHYYNLFKRSEFKRMQFPPVIRLKPNTLGLGRVYPIVNK